MKKDFERGPFMSFVSGTDVLAKAIVGEVEKHVGVRADNYTIQHAEQIAKWLKDSNKSGLVLMGNVGNGKTTMAKVLGYMFQVNGWHTMKTSDPYYCFRSAKDLTRNVLLECKEDWSARGVIYPTAVDIIDDMGEEPAEVLMYGNTVTPMIDYLEKRYEDRKSFIVTTNLDYDGLRAKYGERVVDRMKQMCFFVPFLNTSYRKA